jgi:SAM-dependent methyltransferase
LEKPFDGSSIFENVLELGAGSGEHFQFVRHRFSNYVQSDIRIPESEISQDTRSSFVATNAEDLPFTDNFFDRVVLTCLLHHLSNPIMCLREVKRVVKPGGHISILVPADPGFFYRTLRFLTSVRRAKKLGFDSGALVHALEHRNHVGSLHQMIKYVFIESEIKSRGWPLVIGSWWNLNLLISYQIRTPIVVTSEVN